MKEDSEKTETQIATISKENEIDNLKKSINTFIKKYEDLQRQNSILQEQLQYYTSGLVIDWKNKKNCYYIIRINKDPKTLLKYGLCCAACRYSEPGENRLFCCHLIHNGVNIPQVFPWQICELISSKPYGVNDYVFDGNKFKQSGNANHKPTHNHYALMQRYRFEEVTYKLKEKDLFISFFKSELPDVYRKLKQNFFKKWRNRK